MLAPDGSACGDGDYTTVISGKTGCQTIDLPLPGTFKLLVKVVDEASSNNVWHWDGNLDEKSYNCYKNTSDCPNGAYCHLDVASIFGGATEQTIQAYYNGPASTGKKDQLYLTQG